MQEIVADNGVSGRATTAMLLATDPSPRCWMRLKEALTDKDASVRAAVVHALALRNDPALMPPLVPQFDDGNEAVRLRAAAAYLRLVWLKKPPPPAPPAKPVTRAKKRVAPAGAKKQ